ncbi:hypothetical protein NHJ13051_009570 [Beauveria bassiana]
MLKRSAEINNTVQTNLVADTTRSIARRIQKTERDSKIEQFILLNAPEVSRKILLQLAGLDLVQGTGEWIFGDQKFKKWLQSRDGCLWIKGTAGCGKTGLAFGIFERLKAETDPLTSQVAHVFCSHQINGIRDLQDPMDIVMSFWKHLIDQIREYNRHFDPRLTRLTMPGQEKETFNEKPRLSDKELRKQQKQQLFLHAVTTTYAKNTLSRKQLKQALAWIDREPKESSDWTTTVIDDLTSGLVVTRNDDSVALVHKTLSEYLEQTTTREKWFPTIEKHIPTVLLRLLRYLVVKFRLTTLIEEFSDCTSECLVQDPLPILPLGLAAGLGHVDTVQKLLDIGAKVNVPSGANRMVNPPLYDAFWMDELPTAKLLLNYGADPTPRRGENGQSPIDVLYLQHRDACCDFFASHISGSAPTQTQELQYLVRRGYAEELQRAIYEGLDVNHPCENGKTALDYAMEMGDSNIIETLQSSNARANLQWPARETAVYPYRSNLPDLAIAPIAQGRREWDSGFSLWQFKEEVLLEIPVNCTDPVQCIIFECVSCDQGYTNCPEDQDTYIGLRSRLDFRVKDGSEYSFPFVI